jgi:Gram-negative bacterial TonB protein C-terminal
MRLASITLTLLIVVALLSCATVALSQSQLEPLKLTAEQDEQFRDLLARVLNDTDKVLCKKGACKILIMNFVDKTGSTSNLGIRLAARASNDTIFPARGATTVDQEDLFKYLENERIPAPPLDNPKAQIWLASEFQATVALVGRISGNADKIEIQLQLVGQEKSFASDFKLSKIERGSISYKASPEELAHVEPFGLPHPSVIDGEKIDTLRTNGPDNSSRMTMPFCTYKPDPPYTQRARASKYQGIVTLQAVISKNGGMLDVRPLIGAPYGLNAISVKTVSTWKCKPSTLDGKPVGVVAPIEISFRLF